MDNLPLVTVVTPCYNMGRYLRETIESVLAQDYPRLEYIVMDGGSTDGTQEILAAYKDRLQYDSVPDGGTADAINRGFQRSHGSIFAYLNADDTYLPGAVTRAVGALLASPEAGVVYGNAYWVDRDGATLGPYPTRPFVPQHFHWECFICQPASFIRREVFEEAGLINRDLRYTFDYDLWIRIARRFPMQHVDEFLATSRMHRENKTIGQRGKVLAETLSLLRSQFGYVPFRWVYAYAAHRMDGRDQFFQPVEPSIPAYILSLFLGLWYNPLSPLRFLREWAGVMSFGAVLRRWRHFTAKYSGWAQ